MKTFEDFNNIDIEKEILKLTHLDKLEIKFDFLKDVYLDNKTLFYFYNGDCIITQCINNNNAYNISNTIETKIDVWDLLEKKYNIKVEIIKTILKNIILKYLNIEDRKYKIFQRTDYRNNQINKHFNMSYNENF